jgi:pimeloyl-ACP methyl ester carboxylesterase
MDGTGELFAPFMSALPPAFKAIPIEFPRDKELTYPELADLVYSLLPGPEPFVLVAESFSSPIAVQVAARKSPNLQALILCAGFASSPIRGWRRRLLPLFGWPLRRVHPPSFFLRRWLVGQGAPDSLVKAVRNAVTSVRPEVLQARFKLTSTCDARAELAQVGVPILYLQADGDRVVPPRCLEEILRINPEIITATIEGPHLLLQTRPRQAVEVIVKFIEKHESRKDE